MERAQQAKADHLANAALRDIGLRLANAFRAEAKAKAKRRAEGKAEAERLTQTV